MDVFNYNEVSAKYMKNDNNKGYRVFQIEQLTSPHENPNSNFEK